MVRPDVVVALLRPYVAPDAPTPPSPPSPPCGTPDAVYVWGIAAWHPSRGFAAWHPPRRT